VLNQLEAHLAQVQALPDLREKLQNSGVDLASASPAEFASLLRDDIAHWAKIVKTSGAKLD
jgi:tripartite-type tricarboxylate transporter receptor subunit TctC